LITFFKRTLEGAVMTKAWIFFMLCFATLGELTLARSTGWATTTTEDSSEAVVEGVEEVDEVEEELEDEDVKEDDKEAYAEELRKRHEAYVKQQEEHRKKIEAEYNKLSAKEKALLHQKQKEEMKKRQEAYTKQQEEQKVKMEEHMKKIQAQYDALSEEDKQRLHEKERKLQTKQRNQMKAMREKMKAIKSKFEKLPKAEQERLRKEAERMSITSYGNIGMVPRPAAPPAGKPVSPGAGPAHPPRPYYPHYWPPTGYGYGPRYPTHPSHGYPYAKPKTSRKKRSTRAHYLAHPGTQGSMYLHQMPATDWWADLGPGSLDLEWKNPFYAYRMMLMRYLDLYGWALHSGRIDPADGLRPGTGFHYGYSSPYSHTRKFGNYRI